MVKNESDIIESFVRHALSYADVLLVVDHNSTDETRKILELLQAEGLPIRIGTFEKNGYFQSEVMTSLLYRAIEEENVDIVVAADADEFLVMDDENAGAEELREILQGLDVETVYCVPFVGYELMDAENGQECFLLSRPCCRAAEKLPLPKVIVGSKAAQKYQLIIGQGNHLAYSENESNQMPVPRVFVEGFHIAHFGWRSRVQRASKIICGWLTNVEAFSIYTYCAVHWQEAFLAFLETGELPRDSIEEPVPVNLKRYTGRYGEKGNPPSEGAMLRYTKSKTDCLADVARLAEVIANTCCRERTLGKQTLVSILLLYDGDDNALVASLNGIEKQTYPHFELLLLNFQETPPHVLMQMAAQWGEKCRQSVRIISAPVFKELAQNVHGDYVQWVLPGDVLCPEKILTMLTAADTRPEHPIVISNATAFKKSDFPPPFMSLKSRERSMGLLSGELYINMLKKGWAVLCGLSGALIRREVMERAGWLESCFMGSQPMELSVWLSIWEVLPPGVGQSMVFIREPLVQSARCWKADDFIVYAMEWRYLIDRFRGTQLLSEEEYKTAIENFQEQRRQKEGKLRPCATSELYQAIWKRRKHLASRPATTTRSSTRRPSRCRPMWRIA